MENVRHRAGATAAAFTLIPVSDAPVALRACYDTALKAINQLDGRPDMCDHHATLGGIRTMLRYQWKELSLTMDTWHTLDRFVGDLRNLFSPTRVGRGGEPNLTANLLCLAEQQIMQAQRIIADVARGEAR